MIPGSESTKVLLKDVCKKIKCRNRFFGVFCFYLDFWDFSSLRFCFGAKVENETERNVQEVNRHGERMGRESVTTDLREANILK